MKLLKEIFESDLEISSDQKLDIVYKERKAARSIIFNGENKIAILNVTKRQHHKLPGGGVEAGESFLEALEREIREETGCQVKVTGELGITIEYRNQAKIRQESYCYVAQLEKIIGLPQFTEREIKDGFELMWLNIDEAIKIIKKDQPIDYFGQFIQFRDSLFLEEYKKQKSLPF